MEKQGNLPRGRIAWKLGRGSGYGHWHPAERRTWMQGVVASYNRDYGPDTHWIEEEKEVLRKKPHIRKTPLGDYVCRCETMTGRAPTPEDAYKDWKKAMRRYVPEGYWEAYFPGEQQ